MFKTWLVMAAVAAAAAAPLTAAAQAVGMFTIIDGGDVTVIREAQKFRAAEGLRLRAEDIVRVGDKARLVRVELSDGTAFDFGPGTQLLVQPKAFGAQSARPAQVYLTEGWVKASAAKDGTPVKAGIASQRFDLNGIAGSAVIHAQRDGTRVFVESGRAELIDRRDGKAGKAHALKDGDVYMQKGAEGALVKAQVPGDLAQAMPRGFLDTLPLRAGRFAAVLIEPAAVSDATYADVADWINGEAVLRPTFLQRWGRKVNDPAWRPGLVADVRQHMEWDRLLFPEKYRPKPVQPAVAAKRNTLPPPAALVRALGAEAGTASAPAAAPATAPAAAPAPAATPAPSTAPAPASTATAAPGPAVTQSDNTLPAGASPAAERTQ